MFEVSAREETPDGSETTYKQIERFGELDELAAGQNVVLAVIELTRNVGNLIHLEVERTA